MDHLTPEAVAMTNSLRWRALGETGRVECPRRGEVVELARCLECTWLLDMDRTAGTPALRCAAASPIADGRDRPTADQHVD